LSQKSKNTDDSNVKDHAVRLRQYLTPEAMEVIDVIAHTQAQNQVLPHKSKPNVLVKQWLLDYLIEFVF